jgi:hypothetical protein
MIIESMNDSAYCIIDLSDILPRVAHHTDLKKTKRSKSYRILEQAMKESELTDHIISEMLWQEILSVEKLTNLDMRA